MKPLYLVAGGAAAFGLLFFALPPVRQLARLYRHGPAHGLPQGSRWLMERLVLRDCRKEATEAVKYEGPQPPSWGSSAST